MANPLIRYQHSGHFHFVTFSCYRREPYFSSRSTCELFERSLETMRLRYGLMVFAYVVMPEHVHLLVDEPQKAVLAKAIQALKLSVSVQQNRSPFWQARYYDFNVFAQRKFVEKRRYIHRNPVTCGLVAAPEDWVRSSFRQYASGETGPVEIESEWTAVRRDRAASKPHVSEARRGAPADEVSE